MIIYSFCISLLITFFAVFSALAGNQQLIIQQISQDLEQTTDVQAKSTLHVYRARQYTKIKKWKLALEDYNDALELDHKGWIHLERSHFLLAIGKYELAYEDANAAKEEVSSLTKEADEVIEKAVAEVRRKYEAENPIIIEMNTQVDPYRQTRFDLMKIQGVGMFAASYQGASNSSSRKRKTGTTQVKAACAPKAKS